MMGLSGGQISATIRFVVLAQYERVMDRIVMWTSRIAFVNECGRAIKTAQSIKNYIRQICKTAKMKMFKLKRWSTCLLWCSVLAAEPAAVITL